MEDEFDVNAAVDEIGSGLGFDSPSDDGDDVKLEVTLPSSTETTQTTPTSAETTTSQATTTTPSAGGTAAEAGTASPDANAPPKTWRPDAAATWATLPEAAKQEILKREADIFKGIEGYKQDAGIGKALRDTIDPYANFLNSRGIPPMEAVKGLLQTHYSLATASQEQKVAVLTRMAQSYGINLAGLGQTQSNDPPPYVDPAVAALQKELQTLQSQMSDAQRYRQEQVRTGIKSEVDAFAKDPANPHFDEVGNEVAALLQSGQAQTLKEAYDKAIWLNPAVRNKVIAAQRNAETQQQATATATKVAATKQATSANVTTRARSGSTATPTGTIDDTIAATLQKIRSRS